ncbi:pantoate--beta-alanine ligase [Alicyclobacillus fodiniaquatilis]|uniref:Pantothenate synthetase n=1 Tax=Alicyclobacillus fodiniaquatilis TaxID=1661150 RepID=A0ABW4JCV1_9BACL
MVIIEEIAALKTLLQAKRRMGQTIGLVPTMGYLHEGHLSLVDHAKAHADVIVMSIFVNPLQFGPNEDFERYPRDVKRDTALAERAGVDVLFMPSIREMYPQQQWVTVAVTGMSDVLCGKSRPGHFDGVATVVMKLLNIVRPDSAYFGQKDAQQVAIIRQMAVDLNLDVEIVACPIVREPSGLAMSSRNVYLSDAEREAATVLHTSLQRAALLVNAGEKDISRILSQVTEMIQAQPRAQIDYVEVVDAATLQPVEVVAQTSLLALAVYFGKTRLIDNCRLEPSEKE